MTYKKHISRLLIICIDAAKKFRYAPRFVDGKPVTVEGVQNKFTFEIVR